MKQFSSTILFLALCVCLGGSHSAFAGVIVTSMTLDAEFADGTTADSDYWTTNTTNSGVRLGVTSGGVFLNQPGLLYDLGEIAIHLQPGINTFQIYGTELGMPDFNFFGLMLFFDYVPTPPGIAVYNENGSTGPFLVQPAGTTVIGSANGGQFFDTAPGTAIYTAPDGSTVRVLDYVVTRSKLGVDVVSAVNIGPDGFADTTASLTLQYNPVPEPGSLMLLASGIVGSILLRKGFRNRGKPPVLPSGEMAKGHNYATSNPK